MYLFDNYIITDWFVLILKCAKSSVPDRQICTVLVAKYFQFWADELIINFRSDLFVIGNTLMYACMVGYEDILRGGKEDMHEGGCFDNGLVTRDV